MAVASVSYENLVQTLLAATNQNPLILKPAENQLKEWETTAKFYSVLLDIVFNYDLDINLRWLACVYVKNGIEKHWRKAATSSSTHHIINDEDKVAMRENLVRNVREPVQAIAVQVAVIISKIARFDWPKEWPHLVPCLLQLLQNPESLIQERSLLYFHHVIKALASKRLAGDRHTFQELTTQVFPYVLEVWARISQEIIGNMQQQNPNLKENLTKGILSLKVLRKLVTQGFKTPHQAPAAMQFLQLVFDSLEVLVNTWTVVSGNEKLTEDLKKYIVMHMKVLRDVLEVHPFSYVPFLKTSLEFVARHVFATSISTPLFETLAIQCLNLVKGILTCVEYKPPKIIEDTKEPATLEAYRIKTEFFTSENLTQISAKLVTQYFLLTSQDLALWDADPETFAGEESGESWKYNLRPCTEALFLCLFHEYQSVLAPLLMKMLQDNMYPTPPNDLNAILLKDALYNAVGLAAFDLYEEVDFDQWLTNVLVHELAVKENNYRILRRRIMNLIGQWSGVKLSASLRPVLYEAILSGLDPSEDFVVRLSAVEAFRSAIDNFEFYVEPFLPYLERSFASLYTLLKEASECETKMKVLHVLSFLIELIGAEVQPFMDTLIQLLPALWDASADHNLLRCAIITTLTYIVRGAGPTIPKLLGFVVPVIHYSIADPEEKLQVYFCDDALELWQALVESITFCTPAILQLLESMPKLLDSGGETFPVCINIVKAYIYLCPTEFAASFAAPILSTLLELIPDMRAEGCIKVASLLDDLLICCKPTEAVALCRPFMLCAIKATCEGEDGPLVLGAWLCFLSRMILASQEMFFQSLAECSQKYGLPPDQVLDKLLEVWVDKMSLVSSMERKKLLALAFASLLTSQSPVVLDRVCGLFLRICEAVNDVQPLDEGEPDDDRLTALCSEGDEENESEPQSEHSKRLSATSVRKDPIRVISLPQYYRSQIMSLEKQLGPVQFNALLATVDVETMAMLKSFIEGAAPAASN